jgi:hypothetical protein
VIAIRSVIEGERCRKPGVTHLVRRGVAAITRLTAVVLTVALVVALVARLIAVLDIPGIREVIASRLSVIRGWLLGHGSVSCARRLRCVWIDGRAGAELSRVQRLRPL